LHNRLAKADSSLAALRSRPWWRRLVWREPIQRHDRHADSAA
jgi:hypothetical protein